MKSDTEENASLGTDSPTQASPYGRDRRPFLSSWSTLFTDRLLPSSESVGNHFDENTSQPFVLLDNVMGSSSGNLPKGSNNEASHTGSESTHFCDRLFRELGMFLGELKPARTKGDSEPDEMLAVLQSMGTDLFDTQPRMKRQDASSVRGDMSTFVTREYRRRKSFATKHPCLDHLINTISNTLEQEFKKKKDDSSNCNSYSGSPGKGAFLALDFSMTSVQVARYPGDSKSGYPRHCDREKSCQQELFGSANDNASSGIEVPTDKKKKEPQRLVTCIYYLTDSDWDDRLDGGALRIFQPLGYSGVKFLSPPSYTDVVPYRDRLIVFRSDQLEHQVMPSYRRQRLAITIWFYGTIQELNSSVNVSESDLFAENAEVGNVFGPPLALPRMSTHENVGDDNKYIPSIFVSIASFRDSETRPTVDALFSAARNPRRVFVGIVLQLVESEKYDEEIWKSIVGATKHPHSTRWTPHPHQIRYIRLNASAATGPCYARGLCQTLYRGEDYVLQIDSHMRFRRGWDEYLIETLEGLKDQRRRESSTEELAHADKIVLTTYPVAYELPNKVPNEIRGTYLVPWKFDSNGMLRQRGRLVNRNILNPTIYNAENTDLSCGSGRDSLKTNSTSLASAGDKILHAHRQYLYAGGFNFGPARIIRDVPYDTMGLHHLFFGEELSMAVRLFTHAYDLFAPEEAVCYHLWSRSYRPTPIETMKSISASEENIERIRQLSRENVKKQLIGDKSKIGNTYGLGTVRTAADFAKSLGVDFNRQTFVGKGWDCGDLPSDQFVGDCHGKEAQWLPTDNIESKLSVLDSATQELIGAFLQGSRKESA